MKIEEVEQRTGVGRSNIQYYEKEGLLSPIRNQENNYREYTEEDIKRIEKIKVLRMMGVSPADVKLLIREETTLETASFKIPFVMFGFMTLFIGMSWTSAVRKRERYNQYYAVISATRIINVIGTLQSKRGPASGSLYGL